MNRYLALAFVALLLPAAALARSAPVGTWKRLPAAPISPEFNARTSIWTGRQMIVFGRDQLTALDANGNPYSTGSVNVAAAYDPYSNSWRKLSPPAKTSSSPTSAKNPSASSASVSNPNTAPPPPPRKNPNPS